MLVDDIEIMRRQIKRLDLWGEQTGFYIVDEAEDGQEALSKLNKNAVDLLITDISMPRINGIELLKETYENSLATCVVFLSEHKEFSFAKEAIQYDIFDYLVKPVDPEELRKLLNKVKQHIEKKREASIERQELEARLIEQVEIYYPHSHINDIINDLLEGNRSASDGVPEMVTSTYTALGYDLIKTAIVLQKTYLEIWSTIIRRHEWVEKIVDTAAFTSVNLTRSNTIDDIEKQLMELMDSITIIINTFMLQSNRTTLIREICEFILKKVDQGVNISMVSEGLYLTKNHIGDVFRQETAMTIGEYIILVKVERAKQLIREGTLKNYEISEQLGYNDSEYFAKVFKKNTGLTPMAFKNGLKQ